MTNSHPAIDPRDSTELRRVLAPTLAQCHGRLVLFGSRARGDARRTSDIDIAVRADRPVPAHLLAEARDAIEESRVPFRVDLVDFATAPIALQETIAREGIEWPA